MTLEHTWGKNLDYEQEYKRLWSLAQHLTGRPKGYYTIFFLQLTNAMRISEAVNSAIQWSEKPTDELRTKTMKRKSDYFRLVVIPKQMRGNRAIMAALRRFKDPHSTLVAIKRYADRNLGYNTHALRHCAITHLGKFMKPQEIARLTGHTKIDNILLYTERGPAEEKFRLSIEGEPSHA